MGVGLQPLEFTECLADSPQFRDNLQRHEKELDRTSQQIKRLIKEVKDVVSAAKRLSAAQLALAASMEQLEFACIGASMTEDERVISRSLKHFAHLMRTIEDERDRMLGRAGAQIIEPLERFRKDHIGAVKEGKKKFDKKTAKFCQTQERTLAISTKKPEAVFQEADAAMEMAERDFCQASLEYVFQLQAVQERKKFELVETLLGFVYSWWTFHHTAHDVHADAEPLARDLQLRIQRTRTNFEETSKQTETLMKKMMELRQTSKEEDGAEEAGPRAGYLFLLEKKAFGTTWSKQYASYDKAARLLTLTPYNQINPKTGGASESVCVCGARPCSEPVERRFCWEAVPEEAAGAVGGGVGGAAGGGGGGGGAAGALVLQALRERDRARWLQHIQAPPAAARLRAPHQNGSGCCALDAAGFLFVRSLVAELEARGLEEQGLYRVAGVTSKVSRLLSLAGGGAAPAEAAAADSRTLTSAVKAFLRELPEPLLTYRLHDAFLQAAQLENRAERARAVAALVAQLPPPNRDMLRLVVDHLANVVAKSDKNLMSAGNVAVCCGPALLRPERSSVAAILQLKFHHELLQLLLDHDCFTLTSSPGCAPAGSRTDISAMVQRGCPPPPAPPGPPPAAPARYSAHQQQLLAHFPPAPPAPPAAAPAHRPPPPALVALRGAGRSSSSSAESVSSASASPPPPAAHPAPPSTYPAPAALAQPYARTPYRYSRVRTLYACLGESAGELSFEPNQIITDVAPSGEPGWLRGALRGRVGLVPENYVEPLP